MSSLRGIRSARPTVQRALQQYITRWSIHTGPRPSSSYDSVSACGDEGFDGHRASGVGGPRLPYSWRSTPGFSVGARTMSDIARAADSGPAEATSTGDAAADLPAGEAAAPGGLVMFKKKRNVRSGPAQSPVVRRMTELMAGNEPEAAIKLFNRWKAGELVGGEDGVQGEEGKPLPFEPTHLAFHSVLSATSRAAPGDVRAITTVLDEMRGQGLMPSQMQYHVALRQCARGQDARSVHAIIDNMQKDGIAFTGQTYLNAAAACMWGGRVVDAIDFLTKLREEGLEATVDAGELAQVYEKMVGQCARFRRLHDCLQLMDQMKASVGELPQARVLGDVFAAACDRIDARACRRTLAALEERGVAMDEGSLAEAMVVAIRRFEIDLANQAWAHLKVSLAGARAPQPSTYACMLHAQAQCGDIAGAFRSLRDLGAAHPPATQYTPRYDMIRPLVYRIARSPESLDEAFFKLQGLGKEEPGAVTPEAVNVIVHACGRVGELTRMLETYEAMDGMGVAPDATTFKLLMSGCLNHRHAHAVPQLMGEMKKRGLEPDLEIFCSVIESRIIVGNIYEAIEWRAELEAKGLTLPTRLLRRLVIRAERLGHTEAAGLSEELAQRPQAPPRGEAAAQSAA